MKRLVMGTKNKAKVAQMRDTLASAGIRVEGATDLPEVIEDGTTAQENARKKALAYSKALGQTVLSMDNALFFDGLAPEKQPGIHVRRIGGLLAATDEELLEHAVALVESLGGATTGYWEYGVCIADPSGKIWETTIRTKRVFTSKPCATRIKGYPLESIQIDPESGNYIPEMTDEERAVFWQKTLGAPLCSFASFVL